MQHLSLTVLSIAGQIAHPCFDVFICDSMKFFSMNLKQSPSLLRALTNYFISQSFMWRDGSSILSEFSLHQGENLLKQARPFVSSAKA